jgi:hypothetical protein
VCVCARARVCVCVNKQITSKGYHSNAKIASDFRSLAVLLRFLSYVGVTLGNGQPHFGTRCVCMHLLIVTSALAVPPGHALP